MGVVYVPGALQEKLEPMISYSSSISKRGSVAMYHASSETKLYCQREFTKDVSICCLVSTVAFGMVSI